MDFEDMLLMLVSLLDDEPEAARLVHERFHAFTVDEYQDVNPLQQALLDRWLDGRDESASSATTTRRSTRSRAPPPSTC